MVMVRVVMVVMVMVGDILTAVQSELMGYRAETGRLQNEEVR